MKHKLSLIWLLANSGAAVLLASAVSPAAAISYGDETWADHRNKEDDQSSELGVTGYGSKGTVQGAWGTTWEWLFVKVFKDGVRSCPIMSRTDCKITFNYSPGDVQLPIRIVFRTWPDPDSQLNNTNSYAQQQNITLNHKFSKTFTLKKGQYAYPTMIALDKYIPRAPIWGAHLPTLQSRFNLFPYPRVQWQRRWAFASPGEWEGHIFAKNQPNVCITNRSTPPREGSYRNYGFCINALPNIPDGVDVPWPR